MEDYTKEQLWSLYNKLPDELKEAIFSDKSANDINDICSRNGIEDKQISEVARYTGRVLMGILPPEELQKTLEEKISIEKDNAKKIAEEICHLIFGPVKEILDALYEREDIPSPSEPPLVPSPKPPEEPPEVKTPETPAEEQSQKEDTYREPF